ncbi:hypothetical protein C8R46DRAFT_1344472 [Mycena filopes]|nr:hypothetical protein C8R46DRAFT_1344472 [Mycena filopes]
MSTTSTPDVEAGDPNNMNNNDENGQDDIVVLTPDAATLEKALAERAAKRLAIATRKQDQAGEKLAFGVTQMQAKNYEAAATAFAEASALWRANPVAHCDLATAYLHLGRFDNAETSASTALGLDPKLVEARYTRAMARKGRGSVRGAIVDLSTVLELAPDNEAAQAALRELRAEQAAAAVASSSAPPVEPPAAADAAPPPAASEGAGAAEAEAAPSTSDAAAAAPPPAAPAPIDPAPVDPEAEAAIDAALAHPRPSSPTDPFPDHETSSDTSDARHRPSSTPCLFYNTSHCARGSACAFSHAPDRRSVRDGLGKNVCLYWLVGLCKFGERKCIYKHGREALPEGGWWGSEEGVGAMRERVEREREGRRRGREAREKRGGGAGGGKDGKGKGKAGGKGKGRAAGGEGGDAEGAEGTRQPNGRNAKGGNSNSKNQGSKRNNNNNNNKNASIHAAHAQHRSAQLAYAQQQQEALTVELTRRMALYDLSVAAVARGAVLSPRSPGSFVFPLSPRFDNPGFQVQGGGAGAGAGVGAGGEGQGLGGFTEYVPPRGVDGVEAPAPQGDAEGSGGLTY